MTEDPDYLRQLAAQWRDLAKIGDPAQRLERERWAAALERMAEPDGPASHGEALSVATEEKKP